MKLRHLLTFPLKMRHLITACLASLLLLGITAPLAAQEAQPSSLDFSMHQSSDAPYLMAFSVDPSPHFTIERADGTDSRFFATDVMHPDTNHVEGGGWSPSGQWFAWTANALYKFNNTGDRPFVMSADGQTQLTALADMNRAGVAWSPTADILVVAGLVNPPEVEDEGLVPDEGTFTLRVGLVDPATDTWLATQETGVFIDPDAFLYGDFRVGWAPDGTIGYVWHHAVSSDNPSLVITYVTPDGTFSEQIYDPNTALAVYPDFGERGLVVSPFGETLSVPSPEILELRGATIIEVPIPPTEYLVGAWWNADGTQLLVHTVLPPIESISVSTRQSLWVWSRTENTITMLYDGAAVNEGSSIGAVTPNPDFSRVYFAVSLSEGIARVMTMDGTQTLILADQPSFVPAVWNHTGQVAIGIADGGANKTYSVYDILGDSPMQIGTFAAYSDFNPPALAPNGLIVAYLDQLVNLNYLNNPGTALIPPDSRRYFTSSLGEAAWHPTEAWLITYEDALVAGGGTLRYTRVIGNPGPVRPLGFCQDPTPLCVSWLPSQVDPATLAPGVDNSLPSSLKTVHTQHWMDEIIWSSDGTQLAVSNDGRWWGEPGPFEIWPIDRLAIEPIAVFEVGPDQTLAWQDGQAQVVSRENPQIGADVWNLAISADGNRTARLTVTYEPDYTAVLEMLDAAGNVLWSVENLTGGWHDTVSFSPDGRLVAVASAQNAVQILDAATGERLGGLPLIYSAAVAFSPDGTQLAVAEAFDIKIYAVADLLDS